MSRSACTARARWTGAAALLAGFAACAAPAPQSEGDDASAPGVDPDPQPTAARYVTHLLFAGVEGRVFLGVFDQSAYGSRLTRSYGAWEGGEEGWRRLVETGDTLPTPRAGWRVLPTAEMAVRVGDDGQIVGLTFAGADDAAEPLRLEAGEELSVWTGPTGQRESLGVAALATGDDAEPGLLFFRRAARALSIPGGGGETRAFVLTDSIGNGLLLQSGEPGEPVSARAWLHGTGDAWSEVRFEAEPDSVGQAWTFAIEGTDLAGTIRRLSGEGGGDAPAFRIECVLAAGEDSYRFTGLSTTLIFP